VTGFVLAALASYGFGVTPELQELILYVVPLIGAAWWARQQVTPVEKAETRARDAKVKGFEEGLELADRVKTTVPESEWGINQPPKDAGLKPAGIINNTR